MSDLLDTADIARLLEITREHCTDRGARPRGTTIDRIDNELGYSKANCRWATDDEQANNRRRTAPVTAFGVKRTCRETAQLFGIPERTLYRWSQGGSVDVGSLITSSAARATTPSVVGQ